MTATREVVGNDKTFLNFLITGGKPGNNDVGWKMLIGISTVSGGLPKIIV
jgi:hypothetical protein